MELFHLTRLYESDIIYLHPGLVVYRLSPPEDSTPLWGSLSHLQPSGFVIIILIILRGLSDRFIIISFFAVLVEEAPDVHSAVAGGREVCLVL